MTATPRAFVAMRFGDRETDAIFSRSIRPVLRAAGLTVIRIDKVEHNDDIDDRILLELERADLVVADLTFARPSVYFEAGFAEGRGLPVIYTCRKDHLHPQPDDELGNRRVHFDLQMKNIIDWKSPSDEIFRRRLLKRTTFVLAPILKARSEQEAARVARKDFSSMSSTKRLDRLVVESEKALGGLGYEGVRGKDAAPYLSMAVNWVGPRVANELVDRAWFAERRVPGALDSVCVVVRETFRLEFLKALNTLWSFSPLEDMNPFPGTRASQVTSQLVLCSVQALSMERIRQAFPEYIREEPSLLSYNTRQVAPTRRLGDDIIFVGNFYGVWDAYGYAPTTHGYISTAPRKYRFRGTSLEIPGKWPGGIVQAFKPPPKPELKGPAKEMPRLVRVHLVSGIDSLPSFQARFSTLAL